MSWREVVFHGTKGREVHDAPPSLDHTLDDYGPIVPPTYVYTQREEPKPQANRRFWGLPADNQVPAVRIPNNAGVLGISDWQDAPDPVRQSNFWHAGNKVRPWASDMTPLHTALWKADIMRDAFSIGKIQNYWRPQMYAGAQAASVTRRNIAPGQAQTYGSQFTVFQDPRYGPVVLASGLTNAGMDGDPYS